MAATLTKPNTPPDQLDAQELQRLHRNAQRFELYDAIDQKMRQQRESLMSRAERFQTMTLRQIARRIRIAVRVWARRERSKSGASHH